MITTTKPTTKVTIKTATAKELSIFLDNVTGNYYDPAEYTRSDLQTFVSRFEENSVAHYGFKVTFAENR